MSPVEPPLEAFDPDHLHWGGFFGPNALRREDERPIPTPVGKLCLLCEELVLDGDAGTVNRVGQITHYECSFRQVLGSYGHLTGQCHCFGGELEDPVGMSRRAAAVAAVEEFHRQQQLAVHRGEEWTPRVPTRRS